MGNIYNISGEKISTEKNISILFIGNSLTQDGIAYLPYFLKNYFPEINFKFYIWYNGGYTLANQYTDFIADAPCDIFSVAENTISWTNYNNSKIMADVLSSYTFDIVCMQEYFNYKTSYDNTTDWDNCQAYIKRHYIGNNSLKFISLFHAPLRASAEDVFTLTKTGNALILNNTICEDMIPNGIGIYHALSTSLNNLGDQGGLSPDGTHTQEGLPCLLQTYTTVCWILDKLGINKSIYGCPFHMNTTIYNAINVPGANLGTGLITGNYAEDILAQELAIQAYKEGKQFVIQNLSANN